MSDMMSQAEIDALLEQVATGEGEPRPVTVAPGVRSYDLSAQQHIVRGRLSGLEVLNQRLAARLRAAAAPTVRQEVDVEPMPVSIRKYSDYVHGLYLPSSLNLLEMKPLSGTALVMVDSRLVFRIVDFFFGGSGRHTKVEGREFTETERHVIDGILQRFYRDIADVWHSVIDLRCEPQGVEYNPASAAIAGLNDNVVVCGFRVQIAGGGGEVHLVLPEAMLEPVRDSLEAGSRHLSTESERQWRHSIEQQLSQVVVSARCRVAEMELSLRELDALEIGDFLPLNLRRGSELTVAGVPIHRVQAGTFGGHWAVKIVNTDVGKSGADNE
ncbi:flagellar motor switch protein FliM [Litorivivens lipolytica]|uniref:Flagellar motor switch protein FliM n=1 Tax=Litorivivens lipolytica TaxID=1524264 RepID=A0A7W4Z464_9GAMM|nr:flagellar motor switch protein FliM [Litorivivens lipolytica]MBB3046204.1 flagellar motor switch protein FliM [Litorivivens lipolytica]